MDLNTHADNLECLSGVHIVSKKQFLIEGDRPQLINWERYGLRIGVSEGSLSSTETAEVAVVALVGGNFKFPKDTVLVSAVYAISVSRRLLKPLRLEMQHCVSITRENQIKYMKFVIAPDTPSLSYQFTIVEGGEFRVGNHYGTIDHKAFSFVCIEAIFSNRDEKNYGEKGGPQLSGDMNDGDSSEKSEGRKGGGEGEKEEENNSSDSDGSIVKSKDNVHELQG